MKKVSILKSANTKRVGRLKMAPVLAGESALAISLPRTTKTRRPKYFPKPHLEKIGGMDKSVRAFISSHCNLNEPGTSILRTSISESIHQLPQNTKAIVNLKRVNDVKEINRFFSSVNHQLIDGGKFIGCVETKYQRRMRIMKKFPPVISHIYYVLDFILKRVFPKLPITNIIYLKLTGDRNKVLSRTETFGRLYAAGFKIIDKKFIGHNLYFVAIKQKDPLFDYEPIYGAIFRMRRHGKNGRIIHVYKMRTMHAYSEFIQQYVYEQNSLADGGKLKDDFRVSTLGKFFRKYWVDEIPMIINLLRGDLKIVGVRPLSAHYLSLYTPELRAKRLQHKPGLLPPFYADLPKTLEEIMASEMNYLTAYEKYGWMTDIRYFFKASFNIIIKSARSK